MDAVKFVEGIVGRPLLYSEKAWLDIMEYCRCNNLKLVGAIGRDGRWHLRFVPKKPPTYKQLIEVVKEKEDGNEKN